VQALHNNPLSNGSTVVGYANIRDMGALPSRIWDNASRELPAIFSGAVKTPAEFTSRIRIWLDGDSKRRVLLLLDEADSFIAGDSKLQFPEFGRLQELMDGTARRFKFVLAGLHNVTRIVRTENSPLKQIASDPQRIGPLMDEELPDAERLVARPLSAMGYEFKNRSDVWRILSHCNYYPVLLQTFCAGLIEALDKEAVRRRRPIWEITEKHVREAIENEDIRRQIGEKFDYTIHEIDPRYELIACLVADRALHDNSSGRVDEGMSTVDVLDAVCNWWPQAFTHINRLEIVKDLLDEMVGLGVLRQTQSGAWALRSHAILRLLGDEDHVTARFLSFPETPPPRAFDPRSMRRGLTLPGYMKEAPNYPCPLTMGQEHDLFVGEASISVLFGNALSDIAYVSEALRTADPVGADGTRIAVTARNFTDVSDLLDAIRTLGRGTVPAAIAVDSKTNWDASWIEAASRQRPVREGRVRLALVGTAKHALLWPNFHSLGLVLSGNPRNTAGVDRLNKIMVLNHGFLWPSVWLKHLT
jgi:DNA-binding PadR family transcriptional regulator